MNLKDRMNSGSEIQIIQSSETTQMNQNTSSDTSQKLNQPSRESLVDVQAEAIRKQALEIESLKSQVQTLSSEKLKLTSTLAETSEELSYTQKQNLELAKENDDLRNREGLASRKEQQKLVADLADAQSLLADTKKLVNMSNVDTVKKAQAAQKAAELKAKKDIADYRDAADSKVAEAINEKGAAIRTADIRVKMAKKKEKIAWGSLAATLFCCLIAYPAFLNDVLDALTLPFVWAWNGINDYAYWLEIPYYSRYIEGIERRYAYSTGMAWLLRITSVFFYTALAIGICYGIWSIIQYYRARWCSLSLKVLLISTGAVIVFGEGIHSIMSISLVGLLLFIQVAYLVVLTYLDGYFETRSKDCYWKKIQNQ